MPRCLLGRPLTRSPRVSRADSELQERTSLVSSPRAGRGKKQLRRANISLAEAGFLQLLVDARSQLVEAFVDRNLFGDHLLQRFGPQGGDVEEQRLRGEIDLGAR